MADDPQEMLLRIVQQGRKARDRFSSLIARTETAVVSGDWAALADIVKEASKNDDDTAASSEGGEVGTTKVEA